MSRAPFIKGYGLLLLCRTLVGFGASGGHVCATILSELLPVKVRPLTPSDLQMSSSNVYDGLCRGVTELSL